MHPIRIIAAIPAIASLAWCAAAGGQVVVRAPFVRVYVAPDGATSVRAPFTAVDTPGRYYGPGSYAGPSSNGFRYPVPRYSAPQRVDASGVSVPTDPAEMDWSQLRHALRSAAAGLDWQLDLLASGADWRKRLRPNTIRGLVGDVVNQPPDEATATELQTLLALYEEPMSDPGSREVTSTSAFRSLHQMLREIVRPPLERQQAQLAASAKRLDQSLSSISTGAGWQRYLKLPAQIFAAERSPSAAETSVDVQVLQQVLARFDEVQLKPEFRMIALLPGFQATRDRLAAYLDLLSANPEQKAHPAKPHPEGQVQPEQLPEPRPDPGLEN